MKIEGYLNVVVNNNGTYIRKAKVQFADYHNEIIIWNQLNINATIVNGNVQRPWIEGSTVKKWNATKLDSLKLAIHEFHSLNTYGISKFDWYKYDHHLDKVDFADKMQKLRDKINLHDLVVSHNDINAHNVLWNGKKIILIDFEWSNLNHPLFDYVQFYITENIMLCEKSEDFNNLLQLTLMHFILWTYDAPQVKEILIWREKYKKKLVGLI